MRRLLFIIMLCVLLISFMGCERTDDALRALENAKTVKEDIEKKAKEVKDKVQGIIPGLTDKEKPADGRDKEGSKDKGDDD